MAVKAYTSIAFIFLVTIALESFGQEAELDWYRHYFEEQDTSGNENNLRDAERKLTDAARDHNPLGKVQALKEMGLIQLTQIRDYDKAMEYFIKCLALEDSLHAGHPEIFTYLAISKVFVEVGNYKKAMQALQQAKSFSKKTNHTPTLAFIENEIGKVNASMGNLNEAMLHYDSVLQQPAQPGDSRIEADALFNIGHLYTLQGNYDSALFYHKKALKLQRASGDKQGEALSLNDIGILYATMKNEARALANNMEALKIRKSLKNKTAIAESYNNIGELYSKQNNFERAISNLKLALAMGMEAQSQVQMRRSNEYLSVCYKALGDYKAALEFESQMVLNMDYIQNDRNERQLLESQSSYVIEKSASKINQLEVERHEKERELESQRKIQNRLYIIIGLIVIIGALVTYLYIQNRKSNKALQASNDQIQIQNLALQELNATKDKFFSIISHDLKGPLNSLTSFSGLLINHIESLSKEEIQMLAKDLEKSIKNLFALLENLLEWSRSQTGNIEFKPEKFDITAVLETNKELLLAQAQSKKINLVNENKNPLTVYAHQNSVNTVIRNLISNAIKFTPEGGMILVTATKTNTLVQVSIADDGVGMSAEIIQKLFRIDTKHSTKGTANEKGTGLGLILCKDFVEKNGGKLWVESEPGKGSVFHFTLPA